jgi:hypothetical protein
LKCGEREKERNSIHIKNQSVALEYKQLRRTGVVLIDRLLVAALQKLKEPLPASA